jgi:hypothetical protein
MVVIGGGEGKCTSRTMPLGTGRGEAYAPDRGLAEWAGWPGAIPAKGHPVDANNPVSKLKVDLLLTW